MNKSFKYYFAIWAVLIMLFNSVLFIVVGNTIGIGYVSHSFWVSYAFVMASFVGQLLCARSVFARDARKFFYGLPLIQVSISGLIASVCIGTIVMSIPKIPTWIGVVICLLVTAFQAIAIITNKAAADIISNKDEEIKQSTSFIRNMTARAEILYKNAKTEEEKQELRKLYEAFRYSDTVSNLSTYDVEQEIRNKFGVSEKDFSISLVQDILALLNQRNCIIRENK